MTRTFVVGLDGASWRLAEPWIEAGDLPHLESLRETGAWATNRSCLPPVTFPNWKCYSAGKNPGKLGVYWFEHIDFETERIDVMNGGDFHTAELWDYLNDAGLTAGIVNMPTMYPPREIDGVVVCGGPDAVEGEYRSIQSGYTYPEDLSQRLEQEYEYRVHPDPLLSSKQERGAEVEEILYLLDLRFDVALDLFGSEDLDFVHVTLFYLNVLQHFFWNDEPTRRAWKLVDERLGEIASREDTNLFVMSDHGSAPTTTEFYINEWLATNGYLTKRRTIEDYLDAIGLTRETVLAVAKRLGIVTLLADYVPERVQQIVPQSAGVKRQRKLEKIVLDETMALASGQGPIYLNPDFDVDAVRESLITDLNAVTDTQGTTLFTDVLAGDEAYHGQFVESGPGVVLDMRSGVHVNDGLGGNEIQTEPDRWAAENTRSGLFVANGPDISAAGQLDSIDILDIAPTILAGHGLDVPTDMDGRMLPIFADPPSTGQRTPLSIGTSRTERSSEVADRLKQLGYME